MPGFLTDTALCYVSGCGPFSTYPAPVACTKVHCTLANAWLSGTSSMYRSALHLGNRLADTFTTSWRVGLQWQGSGEHLHLTSQAEEGRAAVRANSRLAREGRPGH